MNGVSVPLLFAVSIRPSVELDPALYVAVVRFPPLPVRVVEGRFASVRVTVSAPPVVPVTAFFIPRMNRSVALLVPFKSGAVPPLKGLSASLIA